MSAVAWLVVAVVAVVLVIAAVAAAVSARRRRQLQDLFGPEYDRTVEAAGKGHGESDLRSREAERSRLDIRPLPAVARDSYRAEWQRVQASFVDRPALALHEADALITSVMVDRGYPVDSFEQQAALASVDHADTVDRYRKAHTVHLRADSSETTTEELREAFVQFRSLFTELISDGAEPDREGGSADPADEGVRRHSGTGRAAGAGSTPESAPADNGRRRGGGNTVTP